MMRSVIIILVLVAAAIWSSTAGSDLEVETIGEKGIEELAQVVSNAEELVARRPACCNKCGACDRRAPEFARCRCGDLVRQCHPSCRRCVQAEVRPDPPLYRCLDMAYYDCQRKCNRAPSASESIN